MRILHLLASPVFSGPMENVALLAEAQAALGHEVTVAIDRKRTALSSEELARPRLEALGLLDAGGLELSVKSTPWRWLRDLRELRQRSVDVTHAHFTHDHLLARWGRPRRATVVRSIHALRSIRKSLPRADAFTVSTPDEAVRLAPRVAVVLPALVDEIFRPAVDRSALRESLGVPGEPLIGMVSTFQASRRHALGVAAFAELARSHLSMRLVLLGDGEAQAATRAQVASLGLQARVTFAGYQSGAAFVRWVQALDEVWVLGLGNDHTARAAAQARRCGVRVIAAAEGALPSLADVVLPALTTSALVEASLSGTRRPVSHPSNRDIAKRVVALYHQVGAPP